ncbi:hypothetical protein VNO78_19989 [Psophocarpus tetragonolobus]|uniref:Uncharacterized protein n=1 Tax=Psophocarpus tetragonolobus TaxID=3891 RepID=A0AAN9SDM2_PSOTE
MGYRVISLVFDASLGCAKSNQLRFFYCRKEIPSPTLKNDEDEVCGDVGTMDPLTPNRVGMMVALVIVINEEACGT